MVRMRAIGLTALLLASSAHCAFGAASRALPPMTAAELLAYAKSLPPSGGGGVVNSNTGPGGATFPGAGSAGGGQGGNSAAPVANTAPPAFEALPATISGRFRPNEIVAVLQPGSTLATAQAVAQQFSLQLETFTPSRLLRTPIVRFRIRDGRPVPTVLAAMTGDARMLRSQPNFLYGPAAGQAPRKPLLPQYALDVIGAGDAQAAAEGKRRPLIAIIDTGIDETHPDLSGSVRDRFDAVGDGLWDVGPHGTGIAGIIAAHGRLLGIAPEASLLSIRAFPSGAGVAVEATSDSLRRGLDWAAEQHADVINMSLAGPEDPVVDATVSAAIAEGIVVVAAAGNEGPGAPPAHPAAVRGVLAVTATDQQDGLFARANTGAYITVSAPGVDILSATPGGGYSLVSGTSQAAAHVSGVVALLHAIRPDLTPAGALALMEHSAKDLGPPGMDDSFGAGRIDAVAALKALAGP